MNKWMIAVGCLLCLSESSLIFAQPQSQAPTASAALLLQSRTDHLETLAREPMLVQHPDGALFVAGYPSQVSGRDWTVPPLLWRSDDAGTNWKSVNVGSSADGAQGNSDVDISVGPDGTLYFASMGFNRGTRAGTQIALGASVDAGASWHWEFVSRERFDDRPWVTVSDDGTAHAVWNNEGGVSYARSTNRGASWSAARQIARQGGSSHFVAGPGYKLALRVSPIWASANRFDAAIDFILVSNDGGDTWTRRESPGSIEWDSTLVDPKAVPRWVEPLAWTDDGALHHIWSEGALVNYGFSTDLGKSWSTTPLASNKGTAFYPYLTSNRRDQLALTWFVKDGEALTARVALVERSSDWSSAQFYTAAPFALDAWEETGERKALTPGGEYIPVTFLADGDLAVVTPVQDIHQNRWGFSFWRFAMERAQRGP